MAYRSTLVLSHFWLAFITFAVSVVLGAWQMWARSPLHGGPADPELYYRSVTAHGTALAYVFPTLIAMGFGYAVSVSALDRPLRGEKLAWTGFALVLVGIFVSVAGRAMREQPGPLSLLPAAHGKPFLLPRRRARRRRVVVLGGTDGLQHGRLETGASRRTRPSRDVRDGGERAALGVDFGRRRAGAPVPDSAHGARLDFDRGCRARAHALLLDAAPHRVLLAVAGVRRLVHATAASGGCAALQRSHGAGGVRAVPGRGDASRDPSPVRGSAHRHRLQVPAHGLHRGRGDSDAPDGRRNHFIAGGRRSPAR